MLPRRYERRAGVCVDITRSVIQNQQLTFASVVRDLTLAVGVTTVGP
jgi:hypothetical protein